MLDDNRPPDSKQFFLKSNFLGLQESLIQTTLLGLGGRGRTTLDHTSRPPSHHPREA